MDSKSIGLCPQGFESPRCRSMLLHAFICLVQQAQWGRVRVAAALPPGAAAFNVLVRRAEAEGVGHDMASSDLCPDASMSTTKNAASEDRTHDLRIMRPMRYQLRYCRLYVDLGH